MPDKGLPNGRWPNLVRRWSNLDAKGDSVGGRVAGPFAVDNEFLDLEPFGCPKGWLGYDLACAHSSYFRPGNVAVNRDIIGRLIEPE